MHKLYPRDTLKKKYPRVIGVFQTRARINPKRWFKTLKQLGRVQKSKHTQLLKS